MFRDGAMFTLIDAIFLGNYRYALLVHNGGRLSYSRFYCYYALISCLGFLAFLEVVVFLWLRIFWLHLFDSDILWNKLKFDDADVSISAMKFAALFVCLNLVPLWFRFARRDRFKSVVKKNKHNLKHSGHITILSFVLAFLFFVPAAVLLAKLV